MIKLITSIEKFQNIRKNISNTVIGFVPTMGNLHKGHLTLIEKSINENEVTIISIFVNPKQFSEGEDFKEYPRTLEQDIQKIKELKSNKQIFIFSPLKEEIYPKDFNSVISIKGKFRNKLCDISRPSHFDGVTTIVYLLFEIVKPTNAYFGQKDIQQLKLIEQMNYDLLLQINIVNCPIIREESGLALSSRNNFLSEHEKKEALVLPNSLKLIKTNFTTKGYQNSVNFISTILENDKRFEYLAIYDLDTFAKPDKKTKKIVIAGALKLQTTRLIDNIVFNYE